MSEINRLIPEKENVIVNSDIRNIKLPSFERDPFMKEIGEEVLSGPITDRELAEYLMNLATILFTVVEQELKTHDVKKVKSASLKFEVGDEFKEVPVRFGK